MPSPFPGMNPYLEQEDTWQDFHQRFCPALAAEITAHSPPAYIVKLEQHVYIHELSAEQRFFLGRADVGASTALEPTSRSGAAATVSAPFYGSVGPAVDFQREAFVEIRDGQSRRLITVVELLSPSNKRPGADRDQYVIKRKEYLHRGVNFVEIDLLRAFPRLPLEGMPTCDYCVLVKRANELPRVGIWPVGIRDPLPKIPIPLDAPDPDVLVDLQQLLDEVYDAARYGHYIYSGLPQPPLRPADAEWAKEILSSAGVI